MAGVTLSMVMGESGLFGKANKAKEQTQISTAKETKGKANPQMLNKMFKENM